MLSKFQRRWVVNYWAGIIGDRLIGPVEIPPRMTGLQFLDFIRDRLPLLLQRVPLNIRRDMWLQLDGASIHYLREVRDFLNDRYADRWIGRGSEYPWPANSPDLSPLDYFLWGFIKQDVYKTPVRDENHLRQKVRLAARKVSREMLQRTRTNFRKRIRMCIRQEGGYIEQCLKR